MNSAQFNTFLDNLGFTKQDTVYFRLLTPKDFDPKNSVHCQLLPKAIYTDKKGNSQTRKVCLSYDRSNENVFVNYGKNNPKLINQSILDYLDEQSILGLAVYVVINPGGQLACDVTEARVIYYENDEHSIQSQLDKFEELNSKWQGGFAVQTRRSVHCYFRLSEPIDVEKFTLTQRRLIKFIPGSDASIHDPSRSMRVPGFDHIQMINDEVVRTPITMVRDWDGSVTSWDKVNLELPIIETTTINLDKVNLMPTTTDNATNTNLPSLLKFIPTIYRQAIEHGVPLGERNSTAKTLASVLIGAANRVTELGIPFCDTPEGLYEQYSVYCDTAKPGELEGIWTRTIAENPTSTLTDDYIVTNNQSHYSRKFSDGVSISDNLPTDKPYQSQYQSLLSQELDYLDIKDVKVPNTKINRAADLWNKIKDRYPTRVQQSIEINHHKGGIPCYIYAIAYDTVFSGLINGKYAVYISNTWEEQINIFTWIVGVQGVNKSHIIKWLTGTLKELNEQYRQDHKQYKKDYKRDYAEYLVQVKVDSETPEPEEPSLKYAMLGYQTYAKFIAALGTQKMDHNSASNLIVADEATTLVGGEDGKVNTKDIAGLLSGFSGGELTSDTKCDGVQGVSKAMMSMLSTTQPVTLENICKTLSKSNGFIERILTPVIDEHELKPYNWADKSQNVMSSISDHIHSMYQKFDVMAPNNKVVISDEATESLMAMERWVTISKSKRAKAKSYILRLAGLYAIYENSDRPEIQSHHVYSAWEMMKMDEENKEFLNINKGPQTVAEDVISKAIAILNSKGSINVSILGSHIHDLRQSSITDRIKVIEVVASLMGSKADLTHNAKKMPVLTLHGNQTEEAVEAYVQSLPIQQTEKKKVIDIKPSVDVVLESSKNNATEEETELAQEVEVTEQITQESEQNEVKTQIVHIKKTFVTTSGRKIKEGSYEATKITKFSTFIKVSGIKEAVMIPNSLIETQNHEITEQDEF